MSEILLGVSGGIACFKSAALCSRLVQEGHQVTVVMTKAAGAFIGASTFEALTGRKVVTTLFDSSYPLGPHIELARRTDLLVVAPATANFIGKSANGISDDLLSTIYLTCTKPILVAPAMNVEMWEKSSVQRNVKQLEEDGVTLIGPNSGWQSCREVGAGRMSEPDEIFAAINQAISNV